MNKAVIIGNLTSDPELRVTPQQIPVCTFTVAVNRRSSSGEQQADFFRVTAWRQLGENCAKYLAKGRKVAVSGPVSARTYQANDGSTRVSLEVTAQDVEFLTPRADGQAVPMTPPAPQQTEFTPVSGEDLPF